MKGRGHLSHQIAAFGRELCSKNMKFKETYDSPTGYTVQYQGHFYPCKVYTKIHDIREELRVTGRNYSDILKLQALQRESKSKLFLIFIDTQLGAAYGDFLDNLTDKRIFCGVQFPVFSDTHVGKVMFFSVDCMPSLFGIDARDRERMAIMISDNKHDKNQVRLL